MNRSQNWYDNRPDPREQSTFPFQKSERYDNGRISFPCERGLIPRRGEYIPQSEAEGGFPVMAETTRNHIFSKEISQVIIVAMVLAPNFY